MSRLILSTGFSVILLLIVSSTKAFSTPTTPQVPPPIVYTIAGSDSGGGAGIQADLHAIQAMGCHGCSAITSLTAQSSTGVSGVHTPPPEFLRLQLETLKKDLYPRAIKIGMLGSRSLALEVGDFLKSIKEEADESDDKSKERPFVVLDPVMISTSGHKLIEDDAKEAIINNVIPYVDVVTPNKFEAEELLGRTLNSPEEIEIGKKDNILI
jgi:hydroxymethylpyrimidine kinase/phosphomethylpyrimidine kinase